MQIGVLHEQRRSAVCLGKRLVIPPDALPASASRQRRPRSALRPPGSRFTAVSRSTAGAVALLAFGVGVFGALHHPLSPWAAVASFGTAAALAFRWLAFWPLGLFTLLPVIGFAPWSGWITFEEVDLLVLAIAAGGYARLALATLPEGGTAPPRRDGSRLSMLSWLLLILFGLSVLGSMLRGFSDAGGFEFGWFQGYLEPMNSVRLAKSFFLAALLLPLYLAGERAAPLSTHDFGWRVNVALALGLAAASLATVWERIAFTGLLNASTDYRTTAMFWEMHVGGAALDGFLALTMPFALAALLAARSERAWVTAAAALALGGYACATTFSRGVYLAVPIGIALMLALHLRSRRRLDAASRAASGLAAGPALLLVSLFGLAAWWIFPSSGWRGLLALLGVFAAWLAQAAALPRLRPIEWGGGIVLGIVLGSFVGGLALVLPKGPYLALALLISATLGLAGWRHHRHRVAPHIPTRSGALLLGGAIAAAGAMALANERWGGAIALAATVPVLIGLVLLTALASRSRRFRIPAEVRWQGSVLCAMLLIATMVGLLGGGDYMAGRFATGSQDLEGRREHWSQGLAMLTTPSEWLFGKGLGRFPASNYFSSTGSEHPGDYRIGAEGLNGFLVLSGGKHMMGWGEILRITQRIEPPVPPVQVRFDVRIKRAAALHFEVCEKHLLYNGTCMAKAINVPGKPGQWQKISLALPAQRISRGAWYAPALIAFSFGVANPQDFAEIDNVALIDAGGRNLIENGDFSNEMAHWFFTSDRMHLPWHIKSLWLNVLFDQGAVGLALFALLWLAALWRVTLGNGRDHPLAPPVAGALAAFAIVGLFDSLLDAPRVALLFYFVLMLSLAIRPARADALRN